MNRQPVITISREFGSGGREIGERIANELGIQYYDRKLIDIAAEQSGLSPDFIRDNEQKITNSFLFNISVSGYYSGNAFARDNLLPEDKLFLTQAKIIQDIADREACVIVGRCADYILRKNSDCLNIFIYSDKESKIKRAVAEYGIDPAKAAGILDKQDKARANHYNHYTGNTWGDKGNYHLCLHSGFLGADKIVSMVVSLFRDEAASPR
ncbi:MAG: cytidylate kinase-like family protein [Oscillospiraceae bacterium]|nr:cytidylate kinase-like family protein [Oscillospiraceae bacterium]